MTMTIADAFAAYFRHLKHVRALSEQTLKAYRTPVNHLVTFLSVQGLTPDSTPVESISTTLIIEFLAWLDEHLQKRSDRSGALKTRRVYRTAIAALLNFLVVESQLLPCSVENYDRLCKIILRGLRTPAAQAVSPERLPTDEIVSLLRATVQQPPEPPADATPHLIHLQHLRYLRDVAIFETLVSSGLRVGELVGLRRGRLLYTEMGAIVTGKGGKTREVLLSPTAWAAIQAYLSARDDSPTASLADLPVFARHDRSSGDIPKPMTTRAVQYIFYDLARRAHIQERFHLTPHTLRHFFATTFLSKTGDLALTQYALGHASPTTTRVYAQTRREDYQRAHRRVFEA